LRHWKVRKGATREGRKEWGERRGEEIAKG